MSAFRVGQSVVCIKRDDTWHASVPNWIRRALTITCPEVGSVCVVEDVTAEPGEQYIAVAGFPEGWFFKAAYFRPLAYKPQSLEHDVAKFRDVPAHGSVLESEDA